MGCGNIFLTAVTIDETSKKLEKVKSGRPSKVVKTNFVLNYFLRLHIFLISFVRNQDVVFLNIFMKSVDK